MKDWQSWPQVRARSAPPCADRGGSGRSPGFSGRCKFRCKPRLARLRVDSMGLRKLLRQMPAGFQSSDTVSSGWHHGTGSEPDAIIFAPGGRRFWPSVEISKSNVLRISARPPAWPKPLRLGEGPAALRSQARSRSSGLRDHA